MENLPIFRLSIGDANIFWEISCRFLLGNGKIWSQNNTFPMQTFGIILLNKNSIFRITFALSKVDGQLAPKHF